MKIFFFCILVFCLLLSSERSGVSERQIFFHLATGKEPVLIENSDYTKLDDEVSKAVVDLQVESVKNVYIQNPVFQQYFRTIDPRSGKPLQEIIKSSGSAVIISEDGYVLTCGHVVSNAEKITIQLPDYRKFQAKVVAHYPKIDLAILKIENPKNAKSPYLRIGSLSDVKPGAFVAAIGNALNKGQTFTDGHVSAKRRRLLNPSTGTSFIVLQHNVAVNPGNSGGALVDRHGNLVGINNAMLTNANAVGFSISVDLIKDYLNKYFNKIEGSSFGLYDIKSLEQTALDKLHESGFPYGGGIVITTIKADAPAKDAGLLQNDIIVSVGGTLVEMPEDLRIKEAVLEANKSVEMLIWRAGNIFKLSAKSIVRSKEAALERVVISGDHPLNGIHVLALTPELAVKMRMPSESRGLLVLNDLINHDNIAALNFFGGGFFIKKGDLLTKVNEHRLEKTRDLTEALKAFSSSKTFSVHLFREGQEIQFSIDGFARPAPPPLGQGLKGRIWSPGVQRQGDKHNNNRQEQLKSRLQELFKGQVTEAAQY
ncbi:MAG: trypsin-like peptidase domain-containing protein [Pseudomonadota bacterium]